MRKILIFILLLLVVLFTLSIKKLQTVPIDLINNFDSQEITFIKTYSIVEVLDYQDNINAYNYIIIDTFQSFTPYLIKLSKNLTDILEKNEFYKFSFKGVRKNNFTFQILIIYLITLT